MIKSVYLSPSNQKDNVGIGNYGSEKYRMNLISDKILKILDAHEIKVYRNKPEWSLRQIVEDSNSKKPDIHVAVHSNASDGRARGMEVFCYKFGGEGHKLAGFIYSALEKITPAIDRGIKQGYNFYGTGKHMYEVAYTKAPAVLIEISFHDNREDAEWIVSHMDAIAQSIAYSVLRYFGVEELTLSEAVKVLNEKRIINSPGYWLQNAVKGKTVNGEYAGKLIKRVAGLLQKA